MTKRNMWLGLGVVIVVAAVIIFAVAHKSNKNTPVSSSTASTSQPASSSRPKTTPSSEVVTTKTTAAGVQYLADGSGNPLYNFGGDTSGVSHCVTSCLVNWPIYSPASSTPTLPANVTVISRSDGKTQYAYKGLPLYFFSTDNGTPKGDGVGDFHLAKP